MPSGDGPWVGVRAQRYVRDDARSVLVLSAVPVLERVTATMRPREATHTVANVAYACRALRDAVTPAVRAHVRRAALLRRLAHHCRVFVQRRDWRELHRVLALTPGALAQSPRPRHISYFTETPTRAVAVRVLTSVPRALREPCGGEPCLVFTINRLQHGDIFMPVCLAVRRWPWRHSECRRLFPYACNPTKCCPRAWRALVADELASCTRRVELVVRRHGQVHVVATFATFADFAHSYIPLMREPSSRSDVRVTVRVYVADECTTLDTDAAQDMRLVLSTLWLNHDKVQAVVQHHQHVRWPIGNGVYKVGAVAQWT